MQKKCRLSRWNEDGGIWNKLCGLGEIENEIQFVESVYYALECRSHF